MDKKLEIFKVIKKNYGFFPPEDIDQIVIDFDDLKKAEDAAS